ncbi:MAG: hypothetical protein GX434_11245 [Peptococcaceae bacterium]|nr:hypothetical protein [Peptococcaceae bacterium]
MDNIFRFSGVSDTLFIPLYCRAIETESKDSIIKDFKARDIIRQLDAEFAKSNNKLHRALARKKLSKKLSVTIQNVDRIHTGLMPGALIPLTVINAG